jgi:hypothetical protein
MNSLFCIFSHFPLARALDILFQIARAEECREDTRPMTIFLKLNTLFYSI